MHDDRFFKDFDEQATKMQKAAFRRFWRMIPLSLVAGAGALIFIAYLVKWVIS